MHARHRQPQQPHLNSGAIKHDAKKNREQTTAVNPVLPPSRMAEADST
jgi:hypothetical protein